MSLGWRFAATARSAAGPVRAHNEDAFALRPDLGLWLVADGMGGLVRGERASRLLAEAALQLPAGLPPREVESMMVRAIEAVHERLLGEAIGFGPSGSTVAVLLVKPPGWRVLWAGDSRIGLVRGNDLAWLTTDHNLAAELVRSGRMDDWNARRHPLASRLTRAVGVDEELVLDRAAGRLVEGDLFLLCSDGLTGELNDAEIRDVLLAETELERAADRLLALAVEERQARDNVTFVLVRVQRQRQGEGSEGDER